MIVTSVYILTIKQVQFANMEPLHLDDPIKNIWASFVKCYYGTKWIHDQKTESASIAKLFCTSGLHFTALSVERLVW